MKTYLPTESDIERKWVLIDAEGQVVGRLAVAIANIARGRHKAMYTPHIDTGDFVVVINADKVVFTGNKDSKKIYDTYSGYMGGRKEYTTREIRETHPTRILEHAIKGMLPNNRLGRQQMTKVKIYAGSEHPHGAQQPEILQLG